MSQMRLGFKSCQHSNIFVFFDFLLLYLQVRAVNQQQVVALVESFTKNVPDQLTLTVNPERSVLLGEGLQGCHAALVVNIGRVSVCMGREWQ